MHHRWISMQYSPQVETIAHTEELVSLMAKAQISDIIGVGIACHHDSRMIVGPERLCSSDAKDLRRTSSYTGPVLHFHSCPGTLQSTCVLLTVTAQELRAIKGVGQT